jgi:hypothetical protein
MATELVAGTSQLRLMSIDAPVLGAASHRHRWIVVPGYDSALHDTEQTRKSGTSTACKTRPVRLRNPASYSEPKATLRSTEWCEIAQRHPLMNDGPGSIVTRSGPPRLSSHSKIEIASTPVPVTGTLATGTLVQSQLLWPRIDVPSC